MQALPAKRITFVWPTAHRPPPIEIVEAAGETNGFPVSIKALNQAAGAVGPAVCLYERREIRMPAATMITAPNAMLRPGTSAKNK